MAQTTPWGVTRVGGPLNGTGKKAWILDTGIDLDHPDLNVDISNSASFYALESADDLNGHGTHVAGIIAAKNNSIGTVGVAAGASVVAVKVCDSGGWCYTSDLKAGIDHVSSNYTSGDVANISLGWPVSGHPYIDLALSILENTIKSAADDGLLFTVAAGNSNQHANSVSPGRINYPNVYVVSAHNSNDVFAGFSNYGNPPIKYSNPGVNILSLWKNGGTETADGTSMAAPHVAGLLLAMGKEPYTNKYVSGDPDSNPDPIAGSSPYVETPVVTHSVQSQHPKLTWQICEGADEYKVYRKVNSTGNWDLWATVSSNSYVDMLTSDPNLVALSGGPNGPTGWVAYKVKSVHDDGFNSNESSVKYFEFSGIIIE